MERQQNIRYLLATLGFLRQMRYNSPSMAKQPTYPSTSSSPDLPKLEEDVLQQWQANDTFRASVEQFGAKSGQASVVGRQHKDIPESIKSEDSTSEPAKSPRSGVPLKMSVGIFIRGSTC